MYEREITIFNAEMRKMRTNSGVKLMSAVVDMHAIGLRWRPCVFPNNLNGFGANNVKARLKQTNVNFHMVAIAYDSAI